MAARGSEHGNGTWHPFRFALLHLFVQRAEQVDAEGVSALPPQTVYVAELKP